MNDIHRKEFLDDALPLIYRAELDGKIIFLEGGFHELLSKLNYQIDSFLTMQELFIALGIDEKTINETFYEFMTGKINKIGLKVTANINNEKIRYLWIGTISKCSNYLQGQLIDIEHFENIQDRFDRLRELTYGTEYLGTKIAFGHEECKMRHLSVMFIDAVDSTKRIFKLSNEKAIQYIEDMTKIITSSVKKYNGLVDKFLGDGAMVIWGYQLTPEKHHENHITNSVDSAIVLLNEFKKYNINKPEIEQIHVRIGLASGKAFSGVFKNPDRIIFTSIGKVINIAARLEKEAETDCILICKKHLDLYLQENQSSKIKAEICKTLNLKGVPNPINACMIRG